MSGKQQNGKSFTFVYAGFYEKSSNGIHLFIGRDTVKATLPITFNFDL